MSFVKPPVFLWDQIRAGDIKCVSADKLEPKSVKSNNQLHLSTMAPKSTAKDNSYRIKFNEPTMVSNIIFSSWANEDGTTGVNLKTHIDMYGDYAIKDEKGEHTKDEYGENLIECFSRLDLLVSDDIDSEPILKRKIIGALKFGNLNNELAKPMKEHMNSYVKVPTIEDDKSKFYGDVDTSRTPSGALSYWIGVAKSANVNNLMIPGTNITIYTKIYDHTNGLTKTPITKWKDLEKFLYTKGDSKEKGIRPFRLKSTFETLPVTFYANSESKKGQLKFKITEHHIFDFDYSKGNDEISDDLFREIQAQQIKASTKYVTQSQCPNPHQGGGGGDGDNEFQQQGADKRKFDDISNINNHGGDVDDEDIIYNDSPQSYHMEKRHKTINSEYFAQYQKDLDNATHNL
jgi:hypothetical protein